VEGGAEGEDAVGEDVTGAGAFGEEFEVEGGSGFEDDVGNEGVECCEAFVCGGDKVVDFKVGGYYCTDFGGGIE